MQPLLALVDCNNFYVSCERVFRPDLIGKPVAVLRISSKITSPFEKGGSRGICLINLPRPLFFKEGSE